MFLYQLDRFNSHLWHHLLRFSKISSRSFALFVNLYSTLIGISGYIFLVTRPSCSSSANLSERTVLLMPFKFLFNSLNLITFLLLRFLNSSNDHLLLKTFQILSILQLSSCSLFSEMELSIFLNLLVNL